MAGKGLHWTALAAAVLAILADQIGLASGCPNGTLEQCEQVIAIGIALGRTECQYKRDFFSCMLQEGCYNDTAACRNGTTGGMLSCRDLCAADPLLPTCLDLQRRTDPAQNFHLCPHIPKDQHITQPPADQDFRGSPSVPFTLTAWLDYRLEPRSMSPSIVFPALWPIVMPPVLSRALGVHEQAVQPATPLFREGLLELSDSAPAPAWTLQAYFIPFGVHVIDPNQLASTEAHVVDMLVGTNAVNLTLAQAGLEQQLRATMPALANITLLELRIHVMQGALSELPSVTTTAPPPVVTTTLSPSLVRRRWRAWRVRCLSGVVHRWEVRELQLWQDRCPWYQGQVQLLPTSAAAELSGMRVGSVISSGSVPGYWPDQAFDGVLDKTDNSWLSNCVGCQPGEAWLGIDAGLGEKFSSLCAVLVEGETATSQCSHVIIEATDDMVFWYRRGEGSGFGPEKRLCLPLKQEDYPLLNCGTIDDSCGTSFSFGTCNGTTNICQSNQCTCVERKDTSDPSFAAWNCGQIDDGCGVTLDFGSCDTSSDKPICHNHMCKANVEAVPKWRLVCASGTASRWWLRNVVFHSEGLCFLPERSYSTGLTSGSYDADHDVVHAFDGDVQTFWGSRCNRCVPGEAWVGLDFGRPVSISCVELLQDERTLHQCQRLTLESNDGPGWRVVGRYGFGAEVIQESAMLTFDLDEQLSSEETRRSEQFAPMWRLVCGSRLERQWTVVDLAWYDDKECSNRLRAAIESFLLSRSSSWPIANAFDGRADTVWKSACGCLEVGCEPCSPGQTYVGSRFKQQMIVNCVKLEQGSPVCPEIALQFSSGGEAPTWTTRTTFQDVGEFALLKAVDPTESSTALRPRHLLVPLLFLFLAACRMSL